MLHALSVVLLSRWCRKLTENKIVVGGKKKKTARKKIEPLFIVLATGAGNHGIGVQCLGEETS